jgi:polyphosphate kinase
MVSSPNADFFTPADPENHKHKWVPPEHLLNREVSWLHFNRRVLTLAEDETTPLLERFKFLSIVGSNMDEFFMKRIGGLKLWTRLGIETLSPDGLSPKQQLAMSRPIIHEIVARQEACYKQQLLPSLSEEGIQIVCWDDLDEGDQAWCRQYFIENVYPVLTPLAVDASHPFPFISNLSLSLGVQLAGLRNVPKRFVRIKVPRNRPRWVTLPDGARVLSLEQMIAACLDYMMPGEAFATVHMFRVTRSIVVDTGDYQDDLYQDMGERPGQLRREIADQLRERRFAPAVRLEVDAAMPKDLRSWLVRQLDLGAEDLYERRSPIGLRDLMWMGEIDRPDLKFRPWRPRTHSRLTVLRSASPEEPGANMFSIIRENDLLLHHPYHDFDTSVLHFVRMAAEDPKVLAIKQTLYRTASDSPIVHALVRAAEQGKQVAVLVELKARLDEHRNLRWAQVLESAGAHVSYGVEDLKTHTKLVLVVREEGEGLQRYVHIGTGNYHSGTARLYTDIGLFTADRVLCDDVSHLFNTLTGYSRFDQYRKLLVAPKTMRRRFLELISREIDHARAGRPARISAKMNQLEDPKIIGRLYEASQAGVDVDLIIRGFCTLRPGLPGLSERIRVISVLGRFLEHHRIFVFHNDGNPEYFIGSADWMTRNLRRRVEAVAQVEDDVCKREIERIMRTYLETTCNCWEMASDGTYQRHVPAEGGCRPAQELMMDFEDLQEEEAEAPLSTR